MPRPPKDIAQVLLVNLLIDSSKCPFPGCESDNVAVEFFPSDDERHNPELLYMRNSCELEHEWLEAYRLVSVQYGLAYGKEHDEAWVAEKETIFVSLVNQELLAACKESLGLFNELKDVVKPFFGESDSLNKHINYLKELIDKAKGKIDAVNKQK